MNLNYFIQNLVKIVCRFCLQGLMNYAPWYAPTNPAKILEQSVYLCVVFLLNLILEAYVA